MWSFASPYIINVFDVDGSGFEIQNVSRNSNSGGAADGLKCGLLSSSERPDVCLAERHHANNVYPLPCARGRLSLGRRIVERVHRIPSSHAVGDARSQARSSRIDGVAR